MKFRIFYDVTKYRFRGWRKAVILFEDLIISEEKLPGEINFIITTDKVLRYLNKEFLNQNYNTDVIAFAYNSGMIINGEIYISKETVKANAFNYNVSLDKEVFRVMIHGILHLTGYDDKTMEERKNMHRIEDIWMKRFFK